jgi:hypothetical protein
MPLSVQTIVNNVLVECGISEVSTVIGNQMGKLLQRSASSIRGLPLSKPRRTGSIAMTGATTYALPTDFRELVPDTAFVVGNVNSVQWPCPPDVWALLKAGSVNPGAVLIVRQFGTDIQIHNPLNGNTLRFEYLSEALFTDSTGTTPKERFTVGTDLWSLDDDLLEMDFKWRFKKEKGVEGWQIDAAEYRSYRNSLLAAENGSETISFSPPPDDMTVEPYTNLWR